ncbi:MAG TPA: hypothetical protein VFF69_12260 [Phycisphaerales bacterium]|nr:hypothetical protein [Phycisphaerales bacterium]
MSEFVCYIERTERGLLPVRLRLVSTRAEEAWAFPDVASDDRPALQRGLHEGAAWVAARLKAHGRAGLGAIVLDADGSLCSWLSTPNADPDAIGAMLRLAGTPAPEEDAMHAVGSPPQLALSADVQTPGGASVQPLGVGSPAGAGSGDGLAARKGPHGAAGARRRLGVLVVPDATVRLLIDELDGAGVPVGRVVAVWHAIAEAFDSSGGAARAERVVAEASATAAHLLVDGASGRLLWVWSRQGEPVAAGGFRLVRAGAPDQIRTVLARPDLSRLASEWIAWSTQLGASPARVRVLLPESAWSDDASLGESVAGVWPGATADIAFDEDPIGAALARFADAIGGVRAQPEAMPAIAALQARPGRQHRAMYRWGAAAIALAAAVMAVAAFVVHNSAEEAEVRGAAARTEWRRMAGEIYPLVNEGQSAGPNFDGYAVGELRTELERRRKLLAPVESIPEKPILAELETLSFVLGNPDYQLTRLDLSSNAVIVDVTVPDTAAYEELVESLSRIGGSAIRQWERSPRPAPGGGIRAQLTGLWGDAPPPPGGVS